MLNRERWQSLEPLLDEVLELAPTARSRWLGELAARSPALAAELTTLLGGEAAADRDGFLSGPGPMPAAEVTLAGLQLGAYRLERPLGQGGMGTVWLARRSDGRFEGQAAVKLLNLALFTATGQERFRREGSVLARLTHPSIARLLDAGVGGANQPYLVLEYVDGVPIDTYARGRALAPAERIRLVLQVMAALAHAHAHLVVHRDLKPSNILVTPDGTVKLLDFGIAKLLDDGDGEGGADDPDRRPLTLEGSRVFTPQYAAPEQVRGEPPTTATDVYALGVLLYVLLSGRHPTGDHAGAAAGVVRALLEDEPSRLGMGDLDTVLARALAKRPTERYQTVTAFAEDVERYLDGRPVQARRQSLAYRLERFTRRNAAGVAAALLAGTGLLGATVFSVLQMREARSQRDAAIRESRRADAQIEFQNLLLSEVGDRPITMRQVLDAGRGLMEHANAADPRFQTAILIQLAGSYSELGDTKAMGDLVTRAESLATSGMGAERLPEIRCLRADQLRMEGSYAQAWRVLEAADSLPSAREPGNLAYCLAVRSQLAGETGRDTAAIVAARRGVALKDSLGERRDGEYLTLLDALGNALNSSRRPREAAAVHRWAIAVMDSSGRGGTMGRNITWHNLAGALDDLGESQDAERIFHDVLLRAARSEQGGRVLWQPTVHYAEVALTQNHPDSAAKYFDAIVAQAVRDTNLYWEGRGLFGLARAQIRLGRLAEARRAKRRVEEIIVAYPHVQDTDDQLPDGRVLDGWLALAVGNAARARAAFVEVLGAYGFFEGKRQDRLRAVALLAAESALAVDDADQALALARRAEAIADLDSLTGSRSAKVGEARLLEARALLARGDTAAAHVAVERARPALRTGAGPEHPRSREAEALAAALER